MYRRSRETDPRPRQGLCYFAHDPNDHGRVLPISTIKFWFSIRTAKRNKDAVAEVHKLKVREEGRFRA